MSVILDTSFIIAYFDIRDHNHPAATALLKELENNKFGKLCLSDYIFDETSTILKKYLGKEKASEKCMHIIKSLEVKYVDPRLFELGWNFFRKFDKLSFTDCTTIVLMEHHNIDYVASYDAGFDAIVKVLK